MANWFHRFFNPHCSHCSEERICQTCETLKYEIERLRADNDKLLSKVLKEPTIPQDKEINDKPMLPITNKRIPWAVRREALEAEDRERARLLRSAVRPDSADEIKAFEDELKEVEKRRNTQKE